MDRLKQFSKRGYLIKETGPVYYTKDMDKTVGWFEEILGWYHEISARDENGNGVNGCLYNIPKELGKLRVAPFTGIHMVYGEPIDNTIALMHIDGIEGLYEYVRSKEWADMSEIEVEWGTKTCSITTIDGCTLKFFE